MHYFLFDNNTFYDLCKSKDSTNINNYLDTIHTHQILGQINEYSLQYTPFSVLEALSIEIPFPNNIKIDKDILKLKEAERIATNIFQQALDFYNNEPYLSIENLLNKLDEEENRVNSKAKFLFNNTVSNVVRDSLFITEAVKALSMDYTIKFDYPKEIRADMNGFFGAQFFIDNEISRFISKFRLAKKLWDYYYQKEKNKKSLNDLTIPNNAMSFKRIKDYLDGDLIHYLCFGVKTENENYRTTVFTTDSKGTLLFRISVYKWIINFIKYAAENENQGKIIPEIQVNNGLLVFCSNNFRIMDVIDVNSIKPLYKAAT